MPIRIQIETQPTSGGDVAFPKDLLIAAIEEATHIPLPPTTKFNLQVQLQSVALEVAAAAPPCDSVTEANGSVSLRWRAVELLNGGARTPVRVRAGLPRPQSVRVLAEAVVVEVEPPAPVTATRDLAFD